MPAKNYKSLEEIKQYLLEQSKKENEINEKDVIDIATKNHLSEDEEEDLFNWIQENDEILISGEEDELDEEDEDEDEEEKDKNNPCENSVLFSRKAVNTALKNKLVKHYSKNVSRNTGTDITDLEKRLNLLKP